MSISRPEIFANANMCSLGVGIVVKKLGVPYSEG